MDDSKLELELCMDCFPWLFEPSLHEDGVKISLRRMTVDGWISDDVDIQVQDLYGDDSTQTCSQDASHDCQLEECMTDLDKVLHGLIPTSTTFQASAQEKDDAKPAQKRRRRGRRGGQRVQVARLHLLEGKVAGLEAAFHFMFSRGAWERHAYSRKRYVFRH